MWLLRKKIRMSYTEHATNEEVLRRANTNINLVSEKLFGAIVRKY